MGLQLILLGCNFPVALGYPQNLAVVLESSNNFGGRIFDLELFIGSRPAGKAHFLSTLVVVNNKKIRELIVIYLEDRNSNLLVPLFQNSLLDSEDVIDCLKCNVTPFWRST